MGSGNLKDVLGRGMMAPANAFVPEMGTVPRVSVVAIFLNEARYLGEAIESVLAQDCDCELIMVDDGSTDGSSAIARAYAARYPDRCHYVDHLGHANRGMSASRNAGIRASRAPYVTFIDGDDVWPQGKLREQMEFLDAHPEIGMVAGAACYWRSWNGGKDEIIVPGHRVDCAVAPGEALLEVYPLGVAEAPCMSLMVRREVLERTGGFEESFPGMYEDQAFLVKVYLETSVWFSSRCWLHYRQHAASCMAESQRHGTYHAVRQRFLEWFEGHLVAEGITDRAVWSALRRAQFRYRHPIAFGTKKRLRYLRRGIRDLAVRVVRGAAIERLRASAGRSSHEAR
jgi:glycosyltransferase involved in cell wall biosynthesis